MTIERLSTERLSSLSRFALLQRVTDRRTDAAQTAASKVTAPVAENPDDFSVTTSVENYLPQSRVSTKKTFKDNKEYLAYLMLLMQKIDKLKPSSHLFVRMEDRNMLAKLESEFKGLIADSDPTST